MRLLILAVFYLVQSAASTSAAPAARQEPPAGAPTESVTVIACVADQSAYVRPTAPGASNAPGVQVVLTAVESGTPTFSLTGTREAELARHLGSRAEISGTVERPRTTPLLTAVDAVRPGSVSAGRAGAAGVTPQGGAAHEPSDALASTITAADAVAPVNTDDPAYTVARLPRLNVTSYRIIDGGCTKPPADRAASSSRAQPAAAASSPPAVRDPEPPSSMVRGCLARSAPGTAADDAQRDARGSFVLTAASIVSAAPTVISAVPGSVPSGSGSGTLPQPRAAPTGDAGRLTFVLTSDAAAESELAQHVGRRVELVGVVEEGNRMDTGRATPTGEGRAPAVVAPAHPSAAFQRLTVRSFRVLGGACP